MCAQNKLPGANVVCSLYSGQNVDFKLRKTWNRRQKYLLPTVMRAMFWLEVPSGMHDLWLAFGPVSTDSMSLVSKPTLGNTCRCGGPTRLSGFKKENESAFTVRFCPGSQIVFEKISIAIFFQWKVWKNSTLAERVRVFCTLCLRVGCHNQCSNYWHQDWWPTRQFLWKSILYFG